MKKLIPLTCLILASSSFAQTVQKNLPVICSSRDTVFEVLTGEEFQEKPVWFGKSQESNSYSTLFINEDKGTWTLVKFDNTNACMLAAGSDSRMLIKGEKIKKM